MPKQDIQLVIFVEHVARELDLACILKCLLEKHYKISVEIASIYFNLEETLEKWRPDVVALPYCLGANDLGTRRILSEWPDSTYLNLAHEQIFHKINKECRAPQDRFSRRHVLHIAWSDFYSEYLRSHGVVGDHVLINGNPVYSLYHPPYRTYFDSRVELADRYGLDAKKQWVFIPENYKTAFVAEGKLRDYIRFGASGSEVYRHRDFDLYSLREVITWWVLAAKQGAIELIVRPRPATPEASFREFCRIHAGKIPDHLHIIKDGTVREWILASDMVISSYSTTLIEAAIAKKPIYILTPLPFPDFLVQEWFHRVSKIRDAKTLMEVIKSEKHESNWLPLQSWAKQRMMIHADPVSNLAKLMSQCCLRKISVPSPPPTHVIETVKTDGDTPRPVSQKISTLFQTGLALLKRRKIYKWNPYEQDNFSASDISEKIMRWKTVLDD